MSRYFHQVERNKAANYGFHRIKRITSHVGVARYYENLLPTNNIIARIPEIPSPYAYSPDHTVYRTKDHGLLVFIVETAHKTYDVFVVPATSKLSPAEV